ncbi:MAG TPA: hypothetical protein VD761_03905 [Solirubrobacterales bacterium]|nr:hypothetical protein [Solirubrobacterales bacterium]
MKARGHLVVLACALALIAVPAGADAKPGYVVKPKSLRVNLSLPASQGYAASLEAEGPRKVSLEVSKGSITATYVARGSVSRKGIEADFGDFGRVSLRFKPKSRFTPRGPFAGSSLPASMRERCKGKSATGEKGVFLGNVSFEGEQGYTRIDAGRLGGKVVRTYERVCKPGFDPFVGKALSKAKGEVLAAKAQGVGVQRFLFGIEVSQFFAGEEVAMALLGGGERKRIGPVHVSKVALVMVDSLEISPAGQRPVTGEVTPEMPFEGTASYLGDGKAPPIWSGTLAVRLPGSGLVPLAGPEFEAEICRGTGKAGLARCAEKSSLTQGSGSHSQPLALARLSSLR